MVILILNDILILPGYCCIPNGIMFTFTSNPLIVDPGLPAVIPGS